jgi:hypothetical protein
VLSSLLLSSSAMVMFVTWTLPSLLLYVCKTFSLSHSATLGPPARTVLLCHPWSSRQNYRQSFPLACQTRLTKQDSPTLPPLALPPEPSCSATLGPPARIITNLLLRFAKQDSSNKTRQLCHPWPSHQNRLALPPLALLPEAKPIFFFDLFFFTAQNKSKR